MAEHDHVRSDKVTVFSVGHSTLSYQCFLDLLRPFSIDAIADVRSVPFSKRLEHFSKSNLKRALRSDGIEYAFLGDALGGRPARNIDYTDGIADYYKMSTHPTFSSGIQRLIAGSARHRIAMMCSEHNPLECHRCLLVGRSLSSVGVRVRHILRNGAVQTQEEIEDSLLRIDSGDHYDFFLSREDQVDRAYEKQSRRVAYCIDQSSHLQEAS